jgi:hypothetical protein
MELVHRDKVPGRAENWGNAVRSPKKKNDRNWAEEWESV